MSVGEMTSRSTFLDTSRFGGEAFLIWLRIAALSFGGRAGQIAVMALHNIAVGATILAGALAFCMMEASIAMADQASFTEDAVGASPKGWTATMTGKGNPKWTVEEDPTARSKARVVRQSGTATFPLLLKEGTSLKNGFVEIWFRAISGSEDRAAGIVWRARDANNYYVVRANALEDNVVAYRTVNGTRSALDIVGRKGGYGVNVPVPSGQWHALRVEFAGSHFKVIFNGKPAFEVEDGTFSEAGQIGLWTKADSVMAFDDVSYGAAR
jgi:3-keto-disaccharide hydrolase